GLQKALQAGQDCRPAGGSAGQDVVADVAVVGLQHRQLDGVTGLLDLVSDERWTELFHQRRPVDVPGDGEPLQWIALDHLTADMLGAVGRAGDEGAADLQVGLDGKAGKIFPTKLGRRQRLPHLLGRGSDIDRVDDRGLELLDLHVGSGPSIDLQDRVSSSLPSAARGIASGFPVSSTLFRPDRIAGHPVEMAPTSLLPSMKPSWVTVSFTRLP